MTEKTSSGEQRPAEGRRVDDGRLGEGADPDVWEVFRQEKDGDPMRHAGNVRAPDRDLATHYARETLTAARADHVPDDDSADLAKPRLSLAETGRPTLTITADHGRIDGDRSNGDFSGSVRVERAADPNTKGEASGPVTLSTSALHVMTKEQRVQTREAVTIEDPRGIIRGKGLEFDNKAKTLRLDSQVSGTFQPRDVPK